MKEKTAKPTLPENLDAEEVADQLAKIGITPSANAAAVVYEYCTAFGSQKPQALADNLKTAVEQVVLKDNMTRPESMLMSQAESLQAIFVNLARRAKNQEYIKNIDRFLKLAFKAQSQCRATLETLAMMKNPPIVYAKQANIAHGHQQVNNNQVIAASPTHAEKNKIDQNELLEVTNGAQLDFGTQAKTSTNDQTMAPVEKVDRAKN